MKEEKVSETVTRSFTFLAIISLVIQTVIPMKMFIHKLKEEKKTNPVTQTNPFRDYIKKNFNKEQLFRLKHFLKIRIV